MSTSHDEALVSRYVDGALQGEALADFERRLLTERALRSTVEAHRDVQSWFADRRDAESSTVVRAGFADAVIARTQRLPSREELLAERDLTGDQEVGDLELQATLRLARILLVAAALIFGLQMLAWGGLLRHSDPGRIEASDFDRIRQIDHAIEQDALRRSAERR